MKSIILNLILISLSIGCTNIYAQDSFDDYIYKYVSKKVSYPEELANNPFRVGERIGAKFTINERGYIDSVDIYTSTSDILTRDIKKVIMSMNSWLPNSYNKKSGSTTYIIPMIFSSIEKDKDKKMLEQNRDYFSKSPHLEFYPECKNNCIVIKTIEGFAYSTVH